MQDEGHQKILQQAGNEHNLPCVTQAMKEDHLQSEQNVMWN